MVTGIVVGLKFTHLIAPTVKDGYIIIRIFINSAYMPVIVLTISVGRYKVINVECITYRENGNYQNCSGAFRRNAFIADSIGNGVISGGACLWCVCNGSVSIQNSRAIFWFGGNFCIVSKSNLINKQCPATIVGEIKKDF